jgi:hypothetical protein
VGDDEPTVSAPDGTAAPASTPAPPVRGANAFIGSIAVDPQDGTVMLGTGLGLFRMEPGGQRAARVVGQLDGGQVSSNLVIRYAGPGELIASGHPEGGGSLPENVGLMRSRDAGETWESVAELGESDYHILQAAGERLAGVRAQEKTIRVSADGGRTFVERTPPDTPLDVAFDAADPKRMVVATRQGVFTSGDEGGSWRSRDGIPAEQLAWAEADKLYRADSGGEIRVSADGGATWERAGTVGLTVNEFAADADGALYAAVAGGAVRRSTDGGRSWARLVELE